MNFPAYVIELWKKLYILGLALISEANRIVPLERPLSGAWEKNRKKTEDEVNEHLSLTRKLTFYPLCF